MDINKSASAIKSSVGPEPCLQCGSEMRSFCGETGIRCVAFEHYIETGETPERSEIGWVV